MRDLLPDPAPVVTIELDGGGLIDDYRARAAELHRAGSHVRIDGLCASACTFVLTLPPQRVCVTPRARLWFHQARDAETGARAEESTKAMMAAYPPELRREIRRRGGLTARWIKLQGAVLRRFFRLCP